MQVSGSGATTEIPTDLVAAGQRLHDYISRLHSVIESHKQTLGPIMQAYPEAAEPDKEGGYGCASGVMSQILKATERVDDAIKMIVTATDRVDLTTAKSS